MSLLSRAAATLKGMFSTGEAATAAGGLLASIVQSGQAPRRGTLQLLQAYRTHPWLHAVVHKIATEVSGNHLRAYRDTAKATPGKPALKPGQKITVGRSAVGYAPHNAEELDAHPVLALLANPNPIMTRGVFQYLLCAYLDVKGEVFVVIERDGAGMPCQLWVVPPHWCMEIPNRNMAGYRFSYGTWQRTIAEDDVLYLKHADLEQPYGRGVGFAETLADELDIDEFASKHLKNWFFNRALPDVFLYVEGVKSETEALRYEEKLRQKHGGNGKANRVHVTNGKVDLKQVGQTFREQMLPELRDQMRDVVLQVYSVPPETMGIISNSNRATIDAAYYLLTKGVVAPRLAFICDAFTAWARREYSDESLCVGFLSPVPEDAAFSLSVMQAQPDLFSKNEWRTLAGKPPVDGWDEEFVEVKTPVSFGMGAPAPEVGDTETPEEDAEPGDAEEDDQTKAARGRSLRKGPRAIAG